MVLFIKDFSDEFADKVKSVGRSKQLTVAVLRLLEDYFIQRKEVLRLKSDVSDLRARLDCVRKSEAAKRESLALLSRALDPDSFFLSGDDVS